MRRSIVRLWIGFALLAYLGLITRLFFIQVLEKDRFQRLAVGHSERKVKLLAERGAIYDRNFVTLAFDLKQYSFGVNPGRVENRNELARTFARLTGNPVGHYSRLLRGNRFVWLARGVDEKIAEKIPLKRFDSLVREKELGRYYPYQQLAAHVLGFTSIDHVGLGGVEKYYENYLQGQPGYKLVRLDVWRRWVPVANAPVQQPVNGNSIVLTLNIDYQRAVEEELRRGAEAVGARSAMAVLMDPNTGEILALACYPGFNPNRFASYSAAARRNRVLVDPYEPGSTFKLVTAAAALESGTIRPGDRIFCENGRWSVPGGAIRDHKPYGWLTFAEVFANSSNIGFAKVAQRVGKHRIFSYARAFGFGEATGIDLPGESKGKLPNPIRWSRSDLYRIPIGYGVLVTAIQLVNAYAAVANGGYLLRPHVLKAVVSPNLMEVIREVRPDTIRRVLKPETARTLKALLRQVVEKGTGRKAAIDGVAVAGKTGTAKKLDPKTKKYSAGKYVASFVGFAPYDRPRFVCLVVVDEPKYPNYYGGQAAAPIFRNILKRILGEVVRPAPSRTRPVAVAGNRWRVPDVRELSPGEAKSILTGYGFRVEVQGKGTVVLEQEPVPGTLLPRGERIRLSVGNRRSDHSLPSRVPDVRGKSLREAIAVLTEAGFEPVAEGSGYVVRQDPPPGRKPVSRRIRIVCKPASG